ncbi:hypothetical protein [Nannocystis exedens]|uniref:hypothetical protein n=1 Tax=Nannocystis exedens TaxID=54 RepID=UPI0014747F5E|nr:hypothetical protein [Nannocystis exedens]
MPARSAKSFASWTFLGLVCLSGACATEEPCAQGPEVWTGASRPAHICGDLVIEGRTSEELRSLAELETIDGSLFVFENPALSELPEFSHLRRIGGSLAISDNAALVAIGGFPALEELAGELYVAENPQLLTFELGGSISAAEALFIAANSRLTVFGGMSRLTQISGDVRFVGNDSLLEIDLPGLAEVGGSFTLADNDALDNVTFPSLRTIGGPWSVADNKSLASLTGFGSLEHAGATRIEGNASLAQIAWTGAFASISVRIENNLALRRISAAETVPLRGSLHVRYNPELELLDGFAGVKELGSLVLETNERLREVAAFRGLQTVSELKVLANPALEGPPDWFPALTEVEDLWIFGNASLPAATVDALIAHVTSANEPRVGDNQDQDTALEPCPWPADKICDADSGWYGPGTGLCASDPEDCENLP